ncbi:MAG: hypothetical protein QOE36_1803 [Gaiellaceae bacterium]|jgi:hypothetical protein|nr:hypothetical protein [Gaiellaceae bacterium]
MLQPGDLIPEATVWTAPNQRTTMTELVAGGSGKALLLFYLFDWSST